MNELEKMANFNKKRQKGMGWFQGMKYNVDGCNIIPNPGDQKAIDRFNNSVQGETSSSSEGTTSGEGLGEDLSSSKDLSVGSNVEFFAPGKGLIRGTIIDIIDDLDKEIAVIKGSNNRKYNVDMQELRDQIDFDNFNEDWYKETGYDLSRDQLIANIKNNFGKKYNFDKYTDKQLFNIYNKLNKQYIEQNTDISKEEHEYINDPKYNFDDERDDEYIVEDYTLQERINKLSELIDENIPCDDFQVDVKHDIIRIKFKCSLAIPVDPDDRFRIEQAIIDDMSQFVYDIGYHQSFFIDPDRVHVYVHLFRDFKLRDDTERHTIEMESLNENTSNDYVRLRSAVDDVLDYFIDMECYTIDPNEWLGCDSWQEVKESISYGLMEIYECAQGLLEILNKELEFYYKNPVGKHISEYSPDVEIIEDLNCDLESAMKKYSGEAVTGNKRKTIEIESLNENSITDRIQQLADIINSDIEVDDFEIYPLYNNIRIKFIIKHYIDSQQKEKEIVYSMQNIVQDIEEYDSYIFAHDYSLIITFYIPRDFKLKHTHNKVEIESLCEDTSLRSISPFSRQHKTYLDYFQDIYDICDMLDGDISKKEDWHVLLNFADIHLNRHQCEQIANVLSKYDTQDLIQYINTDVDRDMSDMPGNKIEIESLNEDTSYDFVDRLYELREFLDGALRSEKCNIYSQSTGNVTVELFFSIQLNNRSLEEVEDEANYYKQQFADFLRSHIEGAISVSGRLFQSHSQLVLTGELQHDFKIKHSGKKIEVESLQESFTLQERIAKLYDILIDNFDAKEYDIYTRKYNITVKAVYPLDSFRTVGSIVGEMQFLRTVLSHYVEGILGVSYNDYTDDQEIHFYITIDNDFNFVDNVSLNKIEVESLNEDYPIDKRHYNLIVDRCIDRDYTEEQVSEVIDKYNKLFNSTDWFNAVTSYEFLTLMFYEYRSMNSNRYDDYYDKYVQTIVDKYSKHDKIEIENFEYDGDIL